MALQKLCDKTENNPRSNCTSNPLAAMANTSVAMGAQGGATNNGGPSGPGGSGLLAFSWACNDAVMTADSIIKCAFCDTPFISKGAYRHHLSKMHFIKDDGLADAAAMKSSQRSTPNTPAHAKSPTPPALSPKSANGLASALPLTTSNNSNRSPTPNSTSTTPTPGAGGAGSASVAAFEESPHSKFLKYTELAKQLSSKYV